jgi:hypothetical protein
LKAGYFWAWNSTIPSYEGGEPGMPKMQVGV